MKIGFTGTRVGMSPKQKSALRYRLQLLTATEFHHGDCLGADADADEIARELGIPIVIHPPSNPRQRAYCGKPGDVIHGPRWYLDRNHDIVDEVDSMIAAPRTGEEEQRSGTWATIRYSRKVGRPLTII